MNNDIINLLSGGIARGITVLKLYPIDTIKTNIQNNSQYNFRKLYNGINIALIGQVPYYMIVFGTYEKIKSKLDKKNIIICDIRIYSRFCGSIMVISI